MKVAALAFYVVTCFMYFQEAVQHWATSGHLFSGNAWLGAACGYALAAHERSYRS